MKSFALVAMVICVAASSCATVSPQGRESSVAVLDSRGLRPPHLTVDSGGAVNFVNDDRAVHQIYSPECPELASRLLYPGDSYNAVLGEGPKTCYFEDLVSPSNEAYAGSVEVRKSRREPGRN